ncbi:MAG: OmpA family protein, partial [Alphaproteobacteria bacterium]
GSAFDQALAKEYLDFATFEADEMYDWIDQDHFARKGLRAAHGELVEPERVENWYVPADRVAELNDGRARLMAAFDKGGREAAPQRAAVAQALFVCWVELWEEGWQFDHIEACRDQFLAALADVEAAIAPKPVAVAPPPAPAPAPAPASTYLVFFDWDRANITPEAQAILRNAADAAKKLGTVRINATGHADRSGTATYNMGLSQRRADAVRAALVGLGIPQSEIAVSAGADPRRGTRAAEPARRDRTELTNAENRHERAGAAQAAPAFSCFRRCGGQLRGRNAVWTRSGTRMVARSTFVRLNSARPFGGSASTAFIIRSAVVQ